jgi:hypothetical protein
MRTIVALSVVISLFIVGCSGNVPLSGKVTFDDGEPVTLGNVFFMTPTTVSQAGIRKDGSYTVGSMSATDGMPRGEYQVYLVVEEVIPREVGGQTENTYRSLIDPKYTKVETSGLTFTADGKTRRFDIQVGRAR